MEENMNIDSTENTIVQEKPKKKVNSALVLGIIGTSTGVLALILVTLMGIGGLLFGRNGIGRMALDDDTNGRFEQRDSSGNYSNNGGWGMRR